MSDNTSGVGPRSDDGVVQGKEDLPLGEEAHSSLSGLSQEENEMVKNEIEDFFDQACRKLPASDSEDDEEPTQLTPEGIQKKCGQFYCKTLQEEINEHGIGIGCIPFIPDKKVLQQFHQEVFEETMEWCKTLCNYRCDRLKSGSARQAVIEQVSNLLEELGSRFDELNAKRRATFLAQEPKHIFDRFEYMFKLKYMALYMKDGPVQYYDHDELMEAVNSKAKERLERADKMMECLTKNEEDPEAVKEVKDLVDSLKQSVKNFAEELIFKNLENMKKDGSELVDFESLFSA